ncbi:hypothetical protein AAH991_00740 [Microbispora sp. ZYX-F-249]|uniref:Uncharacterized protein n=1 Tax=Microbispora maris TaxID=3144104 RepID=A0ABV0AGH0_9ACTN
MSWVGAPAGLSIAGQVAERLRLELRQLGIVADLHEGKGLALLSVWVDLVVWCERGVEGWRYRWWTGRVSDQTGRRIYTGCRADAVKTAGQRIAGRYAELRRVHPLSPIFAEIGAAPE